LPSARFFSSSSVAWEVIEHDDVGMGGDRRWRHSPGLRDQRGGGSAGESPLPSPFRPGRAASRDASGPSLLRRVPFAPGLFVTDEGSSSALNRCGTRPRASHRGLGLFGRAIAVDTGKARGLGPAKRDESGSGNAGMIGGVAAADPVCRRPPSRLDRALRRCSG
jgi:hypothetical protein